MFVSMNDCGESNVDVDVNADVVVKRDFTDEYQNPSEPGVHGFLIGVLI